ncbi:MAG: hypothetical protein CL912_08945 [Deltaproteobacteria bacterium]|nr:hypothetical protein [Deltaproteobacteria bacterium]
MEVWEGRRLERFEERDVDTHSAVQGLCPMGKSRGDSKAEKDLLLERVVRIVRSGDVTSSSRP